MNIKSSFSILIVKYQIAQQVWKRNQILKVKRFNLPPVHPCLPIIFPESKQPTYYIRTLTRFSSWKKNRNKGSIFVLKDSTSKENRNNEKIKGKLNKKHFEILWCPFLSLRDGNKQCLSMHICGWLYMLDIVLFGACRLSERFIHFGLFALWALKFHFFVGRLIENKRFPITDNCLKNEQKRL